MSDDAEQTPAAPIPGPVAPSPQMFARPVADAPVADATADDATAESVTSRFAGTGDLRVDRALAQLPDPDEHRHAAEEPAGRSSQQEGADTISEGHDEDGGADATATGIGLPDPGLLDAHLAEVTSVHRQLQQRLSDLSG